MSALLLAAHAVEHGSHVPVIGAGIVPLIVGAVVGASFLGTRNVRVPERTDEQANEREDERHA